MSEQLHPMTYVEAAEMLRIKLETLYQQVHRKQIPHIRLPQGTVRFNRDELIQWLSKRQMPTGHEKKNSMTSRETAKLLSMKLYTLYQKVHRGQVPYMKFGNGYIRFDRDELLQWRNERRVSADNQLTPREGN